MRKWSAVRTERAVSRIVKGGATEVQGLVAPECQIPCRPRDDTPWRYPGTLLLRGRVRATDGGERLPLVELELTARTFIKHVGSTIVKPMILPLHFFENKGQIPE
jgi:hypothetical protein